MTTSAFTPTSAEKFEFTPLIEVELKDLMPHPGAYPRHGYCAGDSRVVEAAKASLGKSDEILTVDQVRGTINFLMSHRHGTPFEHGAMTFVVDAPIFVWREHHRHRVAFSYNEESGRYTQLRPKFWIPRPDRRMTPVSDPGERCTAKDISLQDEAEMKFYNECPGALMKRSNGLKACVRCGKEYRYHHSARPCMAPAPPEVHEKLVRNLVASYEEAYWEYEQNLHLGVAKEVARACLPVAIYSRCYVSCNPRSLMHFLSLRVEDEAALFPSYPQREIEEVAKRYEQYFQHYWPITYEAFINHKRVAP